MQIDYLQHQPNPVISIFSYYKIVNFIINISSVKLLRLYQIIFV